MSTLVRATPPQFVHSRTRARLREVLVTVRDFFLEARQDRPFCEGDTDGDCAHQRIADAHQVGEFTVDTERVSAVEEAIVRLDRFDFLTHLERQRRFSEVAFGPGDRTAGVVDHIRKELDEVEHAVTADERLKEFVDVVILGLDGAWRLGFTPQQIVDALVAKQDKNERRQWPDWRSMPTDRAIEHVPVGADA